MEHAKDQTVEQTKPKFFTVPNIISLVRIAMIPIVIWAFVADQLIVALVFVILSGVSDKLDGVIARKYNMISETGKWLDPMADKFTQLALCVLVFVLFYRAEDPAMRFVAWVFMGYVGKEVFMLLFALSMLIMKKRPAAAEIWGKLATVVFYVVMSILILAGPDVSILYQYVGWALPSVVVSVLAVLTLVMTVIAFLSYIPDTYRKVVKGEE